MLSSRFSSFENCFSLTVFSVSFFLHNLLQDLFSICCVFSSNLCLRFSKIELWRTILQNLIELFPRLYTFSNCFLLRKEVIHPHVPVGIPCYDFTPIINPTFDSSFVSVRPPASGVINSHGVTGGVYKARERIHRNMADLRLLAIPASCSRVADCNPDYDRLFEFRSTSQLRFSLYRPL